MTVEDEGQAALDDAFASGRDRGADSAAPAPKVETPAPEVEATKEADTEGESKRYRDPENGRFVPLTELKTERTKRQDEARLRTEAENRAAVAEAALAEARRYADQFQRQHQPQQQAQPQQQIPDPFVEPEAYQQYVQHQAQTAVLSERLNMSQMLAEEKHGAEKVASALNVAAQAGIIPQLLRTRNPYAELMTWHARHEQFAEIGPDPSAYKANLEKTLREKIIAEMKQGQQSPQRFPGTLADAPASGAQGAMALSEQQLLDQSYASNRRR